MHASRWPDLVIAAAYMAVLAGIGVRFSRRQTSTETYFVAKRSIPHWAMGLSIFATLISSITFIAYPGAAYKENWNLLVPGFMAVGVLLVVGTTLIAFFRHAVGMSAYEYFEKRFGYGARAYSAPVAAPELPRSPARLPLPPVGWPQAHCPWVVQPGFVLSGSS